MGPDVKKGLGDFLKTRLRLGAEFLSDMGEVSVKKVAAGPRAKKTGEIIAVFSSREVRDAVRGAARELAGQSDAGIRLEIPSYLQPSLKALESVSYNLKKKNPDIKRNIKFDDGEMDLVLDFCISPVDGAPWRRVRPDQAKLIKQSIAAKQGASAEITNVELEKMMDLTGPSSSASGDGVP